MRQTTRRDVFQELLIGWEQEVVCSSLLQYLLRNEKRSSFVDLTLFLLPSTSADLIKFHMEDFQYAVYKCKVYFTKITVFLIYKFVPLLTIRSTQSIVYLYTVPGPTTILSWPNSHPVMNTSEDRRNRQRKWSSLLIEPTLPSHIFIYF